MKSPFPRPTNSKEAPKDVEAGTETRKKVSLPICDCSASQPARCVPSPGAWVWHWKDGQAGACSPRAHREAADPRLAAPAQGFALSNPRSEKRQRRQVRKAFYS